MHRHGVPPDVGRVRVGEQGGDQHQHGQLARVPAAHHRHDEHEVSHPGQGGGGQGGAWGGGRGMTWM